MADEQWKHYSANGRVAGHIDAIFQFLAHWPLFKD